LGSVAGHGLRFLFGPKMDGVDADWIPLILIFFGLVGAVGGLAGGTIGRLYRRSRR
jgi:predicted MFS family arabinose efflux permease